MIVNIYWMLKNSGHQFKIKYWSWNANLPTLLTEMPVAIFRDQLVGHVPFNLSPSISLFLKRDINKAFAKLKVVGEKVNREAGYGLEIACMELVESFWPYTSRLNLKTTSWQQLFTVCESLIRKFTCLHTFMYMCVFIYNCNSWLSSKCVGV